MTNIASLGIQVESGDAVEAKDNLEQLAQAGQKAEKAAEGLSASFDKASSSAGALASAEGRVAESTDEAMTRLTAMAKASLEASDYHKSLAASLTNTSSAMGSASSAATDWSAYQAEINARARTLMETEERLADSVRQAAVATGVQGEGLQALLGKINPTLAALDKLDQQQAALQQYKNTGALDAETFGEYRAKIDQARIALGNADAALGKTGMTAKATAAALRGVPAQFTDIFVSLQGGQAPLTVLLQQGGQLKDMFGGIAPAAKALGGYVLGLVNPFTVAAAAAGALALAYYKGSQEADEYNKAIIFTGNSAGTSAGQLAAMAQQVSATVGTTGAAAEVLAKLTGNSKIASGSFEEITEAALSMEKATGRSIDETVAEFAKIAKDPVAAAKELNDQYNFLTASVYSQIVALKDQGDTIGAAKLLTDTYADTIRIRTGEVTENLGLIESAWKGIKSAASEALDATLSVGRTQTLEQQAEVIRQRLQTNQGRGGRAAAMGIETRDTENDKKELAYLEMQIEAERSRTRFVADRVRVERDGIDAAARLKQISDTNLTNEEKRNKLIKEYRRDVEALRRANPNDPLVQADVVAKTIQNIKDKNKDPVVRAAAVNLSSFNDSKNSLAAILAEYKNAEKELDASQKAGIISQESYAAQRAAIIEQRKDEVTNAYQAETAALEAAKGKAGTSAAQRIQLDQKVADARANMVKAQKDADSELAVLATNEEGRLRKQAQAVQTYTSALDQQVKALRLQGQRSAEGLGLGDRQRGLQDQQNGIADRINQQKLDLANQYGDGSRGMSLDEYNQKLAALDKTQRDLQETAIANYNDMTTAQGSWSAGASSAFQNYLESARDVAGQTKSLFTNTFSSMEDSVANFAISGKFSFADFTKSILADMARIATRQATSGLLSSIAGSALGAWFSGGSAPTSAGSTQAGYSPEIMDNFVSGQRAAGGPVAANSLYEVNELGPELLNQGGKTYLMMGAEGGTITPLGAGPTSAAAAGGGASTSISVNAPVNISVPDRSGEGMELDHGLLQQNMQKQMEIAAQKAVAESWRPGGISHRNATRRT
ncbi:phage tail tape measure protein [Pseudomonas sp. S12(2018)]|uniref:phage tail tape measure protein n=1 Tax=Pseudomonas sp. S12(2018) TaxID=2219664 RepID=UPI0020CC0AF5|nr:phage tail tape measure protein [Pseudomonas sp. S12(2018)]MCQ0168423.1 phage tail tape measure protein [Pseudomonas sp. S12(2018)]